MARDAKRMPSRENEYRNLVLNQRVESIAPFLSREAWLACGEEPMDIEGVTVFAGLDLSESADLTALILAHCDPRDGVWHVRPYFWLPEEGLLDKAKRDRVPYDQWAREGYLETTPGPAIAPEYVAERLREIFAEHVVATLAFDPWNWPSFRPWLVKSGFSETAARSLLRADRANLQDALARAPRSRKPRAPAQDQTRQSSAPHHVRAKRHDRARCRGQSAAL